MKLSSLPNILREKWEGYYHILLAFTNASRDYFLEHTTDEHKRGFKHRLEIIRDYFANDKEVVVDWNRFTTQMTFDKEVWGDVGNLILKRGDEIVRDVLESPIRAF